MPHVDKDAEHEHQMRVELFIALFMILISFLIGLGIEWNHSGRFEDVDWQKVYVSALLGFVTLELLPIFFSAIGLRSLFSRHAKQIESLNLRNSVQNRLTQTLLKAYEYQGEPAFEAVASSMSEFLNSMDIRDNYVHLKGDWFARELYDNFWDELVAAQANLEEGAKRISVFVTHSSSVNLWKTPQFVEIRDKQEKFIKQGGRIHRILIRTSDRSDEDDYRIAIREMEGQVTSVWYLDTSQANLGFFDDHLLTSFNGKYYNLTWNSGLGDANYLETISACSIRITEGHFDKDDKHRWRTILELVRNKPECEDPHDVLGRRPEDESREMYELA